MAGFDCGETGVGVRFGTTPRSNMLQARRLPLPEQSEFAELRAAERAEIARRSALAARAVASYAVDAADCTALLAMLGLDATAGKLAAEGPAGA
jgi:hypothetical protein